MDKQSAIAIVNSLLGNRLLNGRNTNFANVNTAKDVWWLNIPPRRFKEDLHLLLAKEMQSGLIWLTIEANTIPAPEKMFRLRADNGYIDLEISSAPWQYMTDVKSGGIGYNFAKHIKHEWSLTDEGATSGRTTHKNNEAINQTMTKIVVHTDQPWGGDRASWFATTRENSEKLFGHLAAGRNLESFMRENPSIGKGWAMSALYMARQVIEEVAYQTPNPLVLSDRDIMGGKPVFAGTRLPIDILFDCLKDNFTLAEFVDDFPTGDVKQAAKVLALASEILVKESLEREARENEIHVDIPG